MNMRCECILKKINASKTNINILLKMMFQSCTILECLRKQESELVCINE